MLRANLEILLPYDEYDSGSIRHDARETLIRWALGDDALALRIPARARWVRVGSRADARNDVRRVVQEPYDQQISATIRIEIGEFRREHVGPLQDLGGRRE